MFHVKQTLSEQINNLPQKPGIYLYYNDKDRIIYVGKAKKIKNRVLSYFNSSQVSSKTRVLVKNIDRIEHFVVDSEEDALLLENSLIKEHQPRYNVLLKDDKTYPWICLKNEPFPRVFKTRNVIKDGSFYFGPYPSVYFVDTLIDLIKKLYPIRTCALNLTADNILKHKFKTCLEFHLGNCRGACVGAEQADDYAVYISHIKKILQGNIKEVKNYILDRMNEASSLLEFEKAQKLKNEWDLLNNYQLKSTVVNSKVPNIDVFSFISSEDYAFINYLKVVNGAIIQTHTIELKLKMDETPEKLLQLAIVEIMQLYNNIAKVIVVPFDPMIELNGIQFEVPKQGPKLKLLELSERNAKYYKLNQLKHYSESNKEQRNFRVLNTMKNDLRLLELPIHIECFDNSNIQGTNPVAACVVFKNALPSKKDYRHYNIKTVEGANDFASMEEIIYRRYSRLLEEQAPFPQLIVVDGGKGQLAAATNALSKLNLRGRIPVVGIAKRLEELYFPGDSVPLYLDKSSETLKIIQCLRDEAHRFGITFHRKKRSQQFIKSDLDCILGVGKVSKSLLLEKYASVEQIKKKSVEELSLVVGKNRALLVFNHFHGKE